MIRRLLQRIQQEPTEDSTETLKNDETTGQRQGDTTRTIPVPPVTGDPPRLRHRTVLTPGTCTETATAVRTGPQWRQTLWVGEFPDRPVDGCFDGVYAARETRNTDIAIHLYPRDTRETVQALEDTIEKLQAEYDYLTDRHRAGARGIERDLADHQALYDVLRNTTMQPFAVSMYFSVRGENREKLPTDNVAQRVRRAPANLTPVRPRWHQRSALVAASPIARDRLNDQFDATTAMLAGAVGAMFPFVSGTVAEPGIEYGTHAKNGSPVVLDRFARQTGYCAMVIGELGAGKTFGTNLQLLRRAMHDAGTTVVLLDPVQSFAPVARALGGKRVTVGGTRGLNPLEIRPVPPGTRAIADIDPWAEQVDWVMTFFASFFATVAGSPLGDRTQTLRRAVQTAYRRQGIKRDPATFDEPSPTIRDVMDALETIHSSPAEFGYNSDGERERVRAQAEALLTDLRPSFGPDGGLANLAEPTAFDLDDPVVYLDLQQDEGAGGTPTTRLVMQVLFKTVYERAKAATDRMIFAIDEAHYLFTNEHARSFLETAVRHSRHHDLSVQFVTQTGGEFTLTPEARTIADLCSIKLIHRVQEEAGTLADWFGLSDPEIEWVRSATAGNRRDGYAEALLGVDEEGWFPVRVRASDVETKVLTNS